MVVVFSRLAKQKLDDAANYRELEFPGLGERFREEIKTAIELVIEHPDLSQ